MIKPIQILNDLIESTLHRVTVESITDNLDGTYTLSVNNTYYLSLGSVVTINLIDYKVTDFVLNNSLTLSGAVIPTGTYFDIDSPRFIHGTPKKVNGEYINQNINEYPFIWLLEFLDAEHDDADDSSVKATLDLNLFFLTSSDFEDWNIDKAYSYAVYPMYNEIDFFIKTLKARQDLFGKLTSHTVNNHVNFGAYATDKGYELQIITDQLSGSQLRISLPYVVDVCIGDLPIVSKCFPVSIYKDMVFEQFVPSGGRFDYTGGACDNATSIIKDSLGVILYNNSIVSGGTNEQTITDSVVTNSDVTYSQNVVSQANLLLPDVTNIDSDGSPVITPAQTPFVATVCGVVVTDIAYVRDQWTMNEGAVSNITGDVKDYIDTTDVFTTYNVNGITPILDPNDLTKLLTNNFWGNLERGTNDKGGTNYTDVGGGLTSDGATAFYKIDHFTGIGYYLNELHGGTKDWVDSSADAKIFTLTAYDASTYGSTNYGQFRMLTMKDANHISFGDGISNNLLTPDKTWVDNNHWIMNTVSSTSILFWRENQDVVNSARFNPFPQNSVNASINLIVCRNHF